jgi:tRNA pseudouridine55 synthase
VSATHPVRDGVDGVILVDKPAGITSHDVVAATRRRLPRSIKVGHAGTLDPFATGLLLILVGRATRIQRYLMALPKRYETVARLGWTSTTGDRDGEVEPGRRPPEPLQLPTGRLWQRPPAFSAVKVAGERAYKLARRGETVELAPREVTVDSFEVLWRDGDRVGLSIGCSSGTYVRSLVSDLGDAYCLELRRTAIGPFRVDDADSEAVIPLDEALAFLPAVDLSAEDGRRAGHGRRIAARADSPVRLRDPDGLVAIAEPEPDGTLKPVVGFRG